MTKKMWGGVDADCVAARLARAKSAAILIFYSDSTMADLTNLCRYSVDATGSETLEMLVAAPSDDGVLTHAKPLRGSNTVVMMQWERPYMERCVAALALTRRDAVLEIGFGCAYSANAIRARRVAQHTVLECDTTVLQRAREWARGSDDLVGATSIVAGVWQATLAAQGAFDAVFFDDFPLPAAAAVASYTAATGVTAAASCADGEEVRGPSRWVHFLAALVRGNHLRPRARVSGYLARPLEAEELGALAALPFTLSWSECSVDVPPHCPYFEGKTPLLVPVFAYTGRMEGEVEVEEGERELQPAAKRPRRTKLRLPLPRADRDGAATGS